MELDEKIQKQIGSELSKESRKMHSAFFKSVKKSYLFKFIYYSKIVVKRAFLNQSWS